MESIPSISCIGYVNDFLEILVLLVISSSHSGWIFLMLLWVFLQLHAPFLASSAKLTSLPPSFLDKATCFSIFVFKADGNNLICSSCLLSGHKNWERHTANSRGRRGFYWLFSLWFFFFFSFLLLAYHFQEYVQPHFQIRTGIFCWIRLYQRKPAGCYF